MKYLLLSLWAVYFTLNVSGQDTTTLVASKDALIRYYNLSGDTINRGDYEYINMHAWTNSGMYVVHRSLIDFDLSEIPCDSIYSAKLFLFSDTLSHQYPYGHEYLYYWPDNACMIQRITEPWDEYDVNWTNRPDVTFQNELYVHPSSKNFQNYIIDVTELAQDMINEPDKSHGFCIRLRVESFYSRMIFASSDNISEEFHPKLQIECLTTKINEFSIDSKFHIYPNPASDICTIALNKQGSDKPYFIRISNCLGQIIRRYDYVESSKLKLNISDLEKGIYNVSVYQKNTICGTETLIVQ